MFNILFTFFLNKVCEKILLELFCHADSIPFQQKVSKSVSENIIFQKPRMTKRVAQVPVVGTFSLKGLKLFHFSLCGNIGN